MLFNIHIFMQAFQFFINPILAKIVLVLLQYFKELCTRHTIAANAPIEKEKEIFSAQSGNFAA